MGPITGYQYPQRRWEGFPSLGPLEAALSAATGAVTSVPAGLAGLANLPRGTQAAQDVIERVMASGTYQPRSLQGQAANYALGRAGEVAEKPFRWLGETTLETTGSPLAATAAYTLPQMLLGIGAGRRAAMGPQIGESVPSRFRQSGILAGPGAKTANPVARNLAEQMREQGRSPTDIWRTTGKRYGQSWWLEHPDLVPRFEIPDEHSRLMLENLNPIQVDEGLQRFGKVPEGFSHPQLLEAYPDLEKTNLADFSWPGDKGKTGMYMPPETVAGIPSPDSIALWAGDRLEGISGKHSTLLHELQHAIQQRERMARGGSPTEFNLGPAQSYQDYRRLGGEMDARAVEARRRLSPSERLDYPFWFDYDLPIDEMIIRR